MYNSWVDEDGSGAAERPGGAKLLFSRARGDCAVIKGARRVPGAALCRRVFYTRVALTAQGINRFLSPGV